MVGPSSSSWVESAGGRTSFTVVGGSVDRLQDIVDCLEMVVDLFHAKNARQTADYVRPGGADHVTGEEVLQYENDQEPEEKDAYEQDSCTLEHADTNRLAGGSRDVNWALVNMWNMDHTSRWNEPRSVGYINYILNWIYMG